MIGSLEISADGIVDLGSTGGCSQEQLGERVILLICRRLYLYLTAVRLGSASYTGM